MQQQQQPQETVGRRVLTGGSTGRPWVSAAVDRRWRRENMSEMSCRSRRGTAAPCHVDSGFFDDWRLCKRSLKPKGCCCWHWCDLMKMNYHTWWFLLPGRPRYVGRPLLRNAGRPYLKRRTYIALELVLFPRTLNRRRLNAITGPSVALCPETQPDPTSIKSRRHWRIQAWADRAVPPKRVPIDRK